MEIKRKAHCYVVESEIVRKDGSRETLSKTFPSLAEAERFVAIVNDCVNEYRNLYPTPNRTLH